MILSRVENISKHTSLMMLFDYNYQHSFQFCSLILKVINTDQDSIWFFSDKMLVATTAVDERMIINYSNSYSNDFIAIPIKYDTASHAMTA